MLSNLQKYFALLVPYSVTVSTLYLIGYWSSFNINIFEYIGISDIVMISTYQLAHYGAGLIAGLLLGNFLVEPIKRLLPPGSGANDPEAKFIRKYRHFFLATWILCAFYPILFMTSPLRWFLSTLILTPLISIAILHIDTNFLKDIVQKESTREIILFGLVHNIFNVICVWDSYR